MMDYFYIKLNWIRVVVCWALLLLVACVDEIELEGTGGGGGQLVIQGYLLKGCPTDVRVRISRTADFAIRSFPTAVQGAQVFISDLDGNQIQIPETEPGIYQMELLDDQTELPIETNNSYQLSVTTSEGGQYISTMETINPVPAADSVSIDVTTRNQLSVGGDLETVPIMQFFVHTPLVADGSTEKSRFRWTFDHFYRVDETPTEGPGPGPQTCFVNRQLNLDKVVVFNGNDASENRLNGFLFVEDEIDYRFGRGYLLRVNQQSLTKEAYDYWEQVSQAISLSGGLFEAVPGEIIGNISNTTDPSEVVFGYFYASEVHSFTRFVTPDEAGRPTDFCSLTLFRTTDLCFNCVSIPFSSKEIPEGWEQ